MFASPTCASCPIRRSDERRVSSDCACQAANSRTRLYSPPSPSCGSKECEQCGFRRLPHLRLADRKSVVQGKSVSVRVGLGGRRIITHKTTIIYTIISSKAHLTQHRSYTARSVWEI